MILANWKALLTVRREKNGYYYKNLCSCTEDEVQRAFMQIHTRCMKKHHNRNPPHCAYVCNLLSIHQNNCGQHSAVSWDISLHAPPLSHLSSSALCLSVHSSSSSISRRSTTGQLCNAWFICLLIKLHSFVLLCISLVVSPSWGTSEDVNTFKYYWSDDTAVLVLHSDPWHQTGHNPPDLLLMMDEYVSILLDDVDEGDTGLTLVTVVRPPGSQY